jgi:hypothetical protein
MVAIMRVILLVGGVPLRRGRRMPLNEDLRRLTKDYPRLPGWRTIVPTSIGAIWD